MCTEVSGKDFFNSQNMACFLRIIYGSYYLQIIVYSSSKIFAFTSIDVIRLLTMGGILVFAIK